jgi:hypothetical protein
MKNAEQQMLHSRRRFHLRRPEYWQHLSETLSKEEFTDIYRIANPQVTAAALFDGSGQYDSMNESTSPGNFASDSSQQYLGSGDRHCRAVHNAARQTRSRQLQALP